MSLKLDIKFNVIFMLNKEGYLVVTIRMFKKETFFLLVMHESLFSLSSFKDNL